MLELRYMSIRITQIQKISWIKLQALLKIILMSGGQPCVTSASNEGESGERGPNEGEPYVTASSSCEPPSASSDEPHGHDSVASTESAQSLQQQWDSLRSLCTWNGISYWNWPVCPCWRDKFPCRYYRCECKKVYFEAGTMQIWRSIFQRQKRQVFFQRLLLQSIKKGHKDTTEMVVLHPENGPCVLWDEQISSKYKNEVNYWSEVLTRIVDVTLTLTSFNSAFRADHEKLG